MKRILIMGLPGSGKTTFAKELLTILGETKLYDNVCWFNADVIRNLYDDWDFSHEGRIRQAKRMRKLADESNLDLVICDFVAPTKEIRDIFSADYVIWMDTETSSRFQDTDNIFEKPDPDEYNYIVNIKDAKNTVPTCAQQILELA